MCGEQKNDVRIRKFFSLKKANPETLRPIKMCEECWRAAEGRRHSRSPGPDRPRIPSSNARDRSERS